MEYKHFLKRPNQAVTTNGALGYRTTNNKLLDFFWKLSYLRSAPRSDLEREFADLFCNTSDILFVKFLFFMRDIRGGVGERRIFQEAIRWLGKNEPKLLSSIIKAELIPMYGRFDDMFILLDENGYDLKLMASFYASIEETLKWDIARSKANKEISLLAKWLPSINTSSKQTVARAKKICKNLYMSHSNYRRILANLRKYLNVVERDMSDNNWNQIEYSAVPSLANLRYSDAFMKHDPHRRTQYLNDVIANRATINASVIAPHEIVHKYGTFDNMPYEEDLYKEDLELLWKNLPQVALEDTIVVRDGSGSMTQTVGKTSISLLSISTALALYLSQGLKDTFRDCFITFSNHPQIIDTSHCESLHEKLALCYRHDDCSNTNIEAVFDLILKTAIDNHLPKNEMIKNILIISDMQFDQLSRCTGQKVDTMLFYKLRKDYERAGYDLPKLIFWNLDCTSASPIPMIENENGVILMSGFSTQITRVIMSDKLDPWEALLDVLNSERYSEIDKLFKV